MSVSVLVPVLGRPQNAQPLLTSLRESGSLAELVFIVSARDLEQLDACRIAVALDRAKVSGELSSVIVAGHDPGGHDYPRKMNLAFGKTTSEWVLLGSDDIEFTAGWDTMMVRAGEKTGKAVIGSNDKANRLVQKGLFSTHALVSRRYVDELGASLDGPGVLVSEAYDHNFCDRELAALAKARDLWLFIPQAVIRHRHPAFGSAPQDATYLKGRETFLADQALFWQRAERWGNVGLLPQELSIKDRSRKRMERLAATARTRASRQ